MLFYKFLSLKKIILVSGLVTLLLVFSALLADYYIGQKTEPFIYSEVQAVPYNRVGLLLGTSKTGKSGRPNWYFNHRITAAKELFQAQKIDYLIISGDNSRQHYNEPRDMKNALIQEGIDSTRLFLDFAGFRTFDSVVRAKKIFGQSTITIVSQRFHNERAVYIARELGMSAIAYNAQDVRYLGGIKTKVREKFARLLALTDMVMGTEPKFLGESIVVR